MAFAFDTLKSVEAAGPWVSATGCCRWRSRQASSPDRGSAGRYIGFASNNGPRCLSDVSPRMGPMHFLGQSTGGGGRARPLLRHRACAADQGARPRRRWPSHIGWPLKICPRSVSGVNPPDGPRHFLASLPGEVAMLGGLRLLALRGRAAGWPAHALPAGAGRSGGCVTPDLFWFVVAHARTWAIQGGEALGGAARRPMRDPTIGQRRGPRELSEPAMKSVETRSALINLLHDATRSARWRRGPSDPSWMRAFRSQFAGVQDLHPASAQATQRTGPALRCLVGAAGGDRRTPLQSLADRRRTFRIALSGTHSFCISVAGACELVRRHLPEGAATAALYGKGAPGPFPRERERQTSAGAPVAPRRGSGRAFGPPSPPARRLGDERGAGAPTGSGARQAHGSLRGLRGACGLASSPPRPNAIERPPPGLPGRACFRMVSAAVAL